MLVIGVVWWQLRFWPEERQVDRFFDALQQQNYEQAYGVWMHDPDWKQHPDKYSRYSYNDFIKDWGPGGEWGIIKSHHVDGAAVPKGYSGSPFATASGVVVVVYRQRSRRRQGAHLGAEGRQDAGLLAVLEQF